MAEPHASAVSGAAVAGGAALGGAVLGMQYDTLAVAFLGALFGLRFMPTLGRWWSVAFVVAGNTFIAALLAPVVVAVALHFFGFIGDAVAPAALRLILAGAVAFGAPVLLPLALGTLKAAAGRLAGAPAGSSNTGDKQ